MSDYIVCTSKRNAPRVNVLVCKEKCPLKDSCDEYITNIKNAVSENHTSLISENQDAVMVAP
jgi:hypothetical protein